MKCPFFNEVVTGDFNDMCIRYAGLRDFNQETILAESRGQSNVTRTKRLMY